MKIPTYTSHQSVDPKTGYSTPETQQYNDNLNQQMQRNLSDDGYVVPSRKITDIMAITSPSNPNAKPNGTIWYATDLNEFVGLQNGILVSFNTTPI